MWGVRPALTSWCWPIVILRTKMKTKRSQIAKSPTQAIGLVPGCFMSRRNA